MEIFIHRWEPSAGLVKYASNWNSLEIHLRHLVSLSVAFVEGVSFLCNVEDAIWYAVYNAMNMLLSVRSEMRMLREQETAMNKLRDRRARFEMRLSETQRIISEFKNRERMSDAPQYVEVFDQLKKRVEEFIAEVIFYWYDNA